MIYYVKGDFMSRKDIEPAALTVHPNGIPHGPHPGTYEGSIGKTGPTSSRSWSIRFGRCSSQLMRLLWKIPRTFSWTDRS